MEPAFLRIYFREYSSIVSRIVPRAIWPMLTNQKAKEEIT